MLKSNNISPEPDRLVLTQMLFLYQPSLCFMLQIDCDRSHETPATLWKNPGKSIENYGSSPM